MRGELGIHPPESRYITLHGRVGALGEDYVRLYKDYKKLAQGLSATVVHVNDAKAEAVAARLEVRALALELEQLRGAGTGSTAALQGLRRELREAKADCESLKDTVLAMVTAVNGLISQVGQPGGQPSVNVEV